MSSEKRYFGTDGIRGRANREPVSAETMMKAGRAAARFFRERNNNNRCAVIIGQDTRISSDMVNAAITAGFCSGGVDVKNAGIIPTPAVGLLSRASDAAGGVMVSASHNPFGDNGIKFFNSSGEKLTDDEEDCIEILMAREKTEEDLLDGSELGRVKHLTNEQNLYRDHLAATTPADRPFSGMTIVLDCANGAAFRIAPTLLSDLGVNVISTGVTPDGVNINKNVGALHAENISETVRRERADAGICFDGDADRIICVDETGEIVDGDRIMGLLAVDMKKQGLLEKDSLITTVMSNSGLESYLEEHGITMIRTDVGDRYVFKKMKETGAVLGGENSGHIILSRDNSTGDALLTGLKVLDLLHRSDRTFSELASQIHLLPQIQKKVRVTSKPSIEEIPIVLNAVKKGEKTLGGGRILIRYSGTEPVMRVIAECNDPERARSVTENICAIVGKILGA